MTLNTIWLVIIDLYQFVFNIQNITPEHHEVVEVVKPILTIDAPKEILKFSTSTFVTPSRMLDKNAHSTSISSVVIKNETKDSHDIDSDQIEIPTIVTEPPVSSEVSVTSATSTVEEVPPVEVESQISDKIFNTTKPSSPFIPFDLVPATMYVQNKTGANCFVGPHEDFDCVVSKLEYGTAVTVVGYDGRYAKINKPNLSGYVLKEDLTPVKNNVWPIFLDQKVYDALSEETKKTRLLIHDMFFSDRLQLPLQAGEYIVTRLMTEHRFINWSQKRPRIAGSWQGLLKGRSGIHITVSPKTDSIMEWVNDAGEGRLAYIEAVSPEKTLTITTVGVDNEGMFSIMILTESLWRELRPIFIEVT